MNRKTMIAEIIRLIGPKSTSKFYADDLAHLKAHLAKKTDAQLRETLGRASYVPSKREIDLHCQPYRLGDDRAGYR